MPILLDSCSHPGNISEFKICLNSLPKITSQNLVRIYDSSVNFFIMHFNDFVYIVHVTLDDRDFTAVKNLYGFCDILGSACL